VAVRAKKLVAVVNMMLRRTGRKERDVSRANAMEKAIGCTDCTHQLADGKRPSLR
jgi:hypothetical protein